MRAFLKRFVRNERALAWQLTVGILSIVFMPLLYLPVSVAFDGIYYAITAAYTFTGPMGFAVTFAKVFVDYLLSLFLAFVVFWVLVNAKADPYGGL